MNESRDLRVGEPWGPRLWLALAVVLLVGSAIQTYGINKWPMADDEVPSLVEMGLLDVEARTFSVPADQIPRLPRAVPVWYKSQRLLIDLLPKGELSYRLPSVLWGVLTAVVIFATAARGRSLLFATAVAIMMWGSQPFVYLLQLDRFYSLPLFLLVMTFVAIWTIRRDAVALPAIVLLTVLTVLAHNVTLVVFALAFGASTAVWVLARGSLVRVVRTGVAFATSVAVYLIYLRPIVSGWNSTGNPTPPLVSFAAHAGIPALALAFLGSILALVQWRRAGAIVWWTLVFAGSLCAFQVGPIMWNPRYFLFFLPPVWVLAAYAMERVAVALADRRLALAWYASVALLLMPGLLSHFIDGSRHDYRQAAAVILAADTQENPILSDDAETISYYLPLNLRKKLFVRTKVTQPPESEFFLVARSNAWMPLPQMGTRRMELLAEIYKRRFDQFSHILRVYRVAPDDRH